MDETVGMGMQSQERVLFIRMAEIIAKYLREPSYLAISREWSEIGPEVRDVVARLESELEP